MGTAFYALLAAVLNIVGTASVMGQRLAPHHRSVLAGNMRLAAHRLEQDRVPRQTFEANGNVRRAII